MWNKIHSIFGDSQKINPVNNSSNQKDSSIMSSVDSNEIESSPNRMSLSSALVYLIKTYGITCLLGNNLVSFLNDLTDYEGNRAAKSLLRELVVNQTLDEFCKSPEKNILDRVRQKVLVEYGFNNQITDYVISSIAEATGITRHTEIDITDITSKENVSSSPTKIPPKVAYEILFMGLQLGEHIDIFKRVLYSKRFRSLSFIRYRGLVNMYKDQGGDMTDYELVDWEEYEGQFADQDCMSLVLFATPITHRVFRVDVKMRYSQDKDGEYGRDYIYKRYTFFHDLLTSKYGLPLHEATVDLSASAESNEGCGIIYNDGKTTLTLMIENALPSTHYYHAVLHYSLNDVPTLALEKTQKAAIIDNENKAHRQQLLSDI